MLSHVHVYRYFFPKWWLKLLISRIASIGWICLEMFQHVDKFIIRINNHAFIWSSKNGGYMYIGWKSGLRAFPFISLLCNGLDANEVQSYFSNIILTKYEIEFFFLLILKHYITSTKHMLINFYEVLNIF